MNVGFTKLMQTLSYIGLCTYTNTVYMSPYHYVGTTVWAPHAFTSFCCQEYYRSKAVHLRIIVTFLTRFQQTFFFLMPSYFVKTGRSSRLGRDIHNFIGSWWSCPLCAVNLLIFLALPYRERPQRRTQAFVAATYIETYCYYK